MVMRYASTSISVPDQCKQISHTCKDRGAAPHRFKMLLQRIMNKAPKMIRCQPITIILSIVIFILLGRDYQRSAYNENDELQADLSRRNLQSSSNYDSGYKKTDNLVNYDKNIPLIWIGGVPRSGTTLMRAILDAHPEVRCGEETRVIPRVLGMHGQMSKSQLEMNRLREAKITQDILNNAIGAYILSIIFNHGEPANRLCNKDPFALRSMPRLVKIFPQSKFILMVRDGRATVHSIMSRKITIKGFNLKTFRGALQDWNKAIASMYQQCLHMGKHRCLLVHYEQLVLHPKAEMTKVLKFLDIPWDDVVLHHEQTVGKAGGISLSKKEPSTNQVNKPVNTLALTKWAGNIPEDLLPDMAAIAPMLKKLGYDPTANPPKYGEPDQEVKEHSKLLDFEEKIALTNKQGQNGAEEGEVKIDAL